MWGRRNKRRGGTWNKSVGWMYTLTGTKTRLCIRVTWVERCFGLDMEFSEEFTSDL